MIYQEEDIFKNALLLWGVESQNDQFIEEASEAIQAIIHFRRGRCDNERVISELVDTQIMINQLKYIYGTDTFERVYDNTVKSLANLIQKERGYKQE